MSQTICELCGKNFSSRQRLDYHLQKQVCQKTTYGCPNCGSMFSTKLRLQYHVEHNVCQKKLKIRIRQPTQPTIDDYKNLSKDELIMKLIKTETEVSVLKEHPQTINNYMLINFGQENINEIKVKYPHLLDDAIKNHLTHSIPFLTKQIHCNQEIFPQYNNVFIDSYRNPYAMVYSNGKFHRQLKKNTIDQIIDECIHMLGDHVDDNIIDEKLIKKYELYRDSVDIDGHRRKELEDELIGILLDQGERLKLDTNFRLLLQDYIKH
jgi:hypothetical protein